MRCRLPKQWRPACHSWEWSTSIRTLDAFTLGNGSRTGDGRGLSFLFDCRHVLFGKLRPYLRKIALPESKGCSSTELIPLLPNPAYLDRGYLFYWLRRSEVIDSLMVKYTGARMPRADMSVLLAMNLPVPPLGEQRRIVALLDRAAAIRRRAEAARAKARADHPRPVSRHLRRPRHQPEGLADGSCWHPSRKYLLRN